MFGFITKRGFVLNLIIAIGLFALICYVLLNALGGITGHNEYEKVPDVVGLPYSQAEKVLSDKSFRVEILDSVWMPSMKPGSIVKQSPESKATVKAKRKIFLTVNRQQAPLIELPNLVGLSFRNAAIFLKQLGLELGDTTRRPDIARDAVLEQTYNGRPIAGGTRIFLGSKIDFVLGSGLGNQEILVPDLFGMKYSEAKLLLQDYGLNIGAVIADYDVKDTANAYVYKQNPEKTKKDDDGNTISNRIRVGQAIDLFLKLEKPAIREIDPTEMDENPDAKLPE